MPWNPYVIKHVSAIWHHVDHQKTDEEIAEEEDTFHESGIRPEQVISEQKFIRAMVKTALWRPPTP